MDNRDDIFGNETNEDIPFFGEKEELFDIKPKGTDIFAKPQGTNIFESEDFIQEGNYNRGPMRKIHMYQQGYAPQRGRPQKGSYVNRQDNYFYNNKNNTDLLLGTRHDLSFDFTPTKSKNKVFHSQARELSNNPYKEVYNNPLLNNPFSKSTPIFDFGYKDDVESRQPINPFADFKPQKEKLINPADIFADSTKHEHTLTKFKKKRKVASPYTNTFNDSIHPSTYSSMEYIKKNTSANFSSKFADGSAQEFRETPEMIFSRHRYTTVDRANRVPLQMPIYSPAPQHFTPLPHNDPHQFTVLPLLLGTRLEKTANNTKHFVYIAKVFLHKISKLNLESVTVNTLKGLMREFGLNYGGKKNELIDRLLNVRSDVLKKMDELEVLK